MICTLGMNTDKPVSKRELLEQLKSLDFKTLPPHVQDELTRYLETEAIEAAKTDFYKFVLLMGPVLVDGFETGRHIEIICEELQTAAENIWKRTGRTHRTQISLPPGGMKSQLCTRMFPAWCLGRWPKIRILVVGYALEFSRAEFGSKILQILRTEEYQRIFPGTQLHEDKQTAGRFLTTDNGEMFATSIDAKNAGRRCHLLISDDALVEADALSKPIRSRVVKDYVPNVRSRLLMTPDGAEIMAGTRWVQGDLFDYMFEADAKSGNPWNRIVIPALLTEEASEFMRRPGDPEGYLAPGTSFWPEFHPTLKLESTRASMTNTMSRWNAVYMQNPTPEEGALLSPNDFQHWTESKPPQFHTILITADTAYTKNTQSDFTAYQVWGLFNKTEQMGEGQTNVRCHALLLDAKKGKWEFPELCDKFMELYRSRRPDYFVLEERSSGLALIPELRKRGLPVYGWKTEKDKITRMQAAAPLVRSGCIWVPMPPAHPDVIEKSTEFVGELCMFPGGNHDDVADAFSQFVVFARDNNLLFSTDYTDAVVEEEDDGSAYRSVARSYTSALLGNR